MANYQVQVKASARKELDRLPSPVLARIIPALENLVANPRPHGCKKLKGGMNDWRIRVGEYRVVYIIDDKKKLVEITRIRHRSDVYKP